MLALTVVKGGAVTIGEITVYNNDDYPIKVAIDAPRDMDISRVKAEDNPRRK